MNDLSKLAAPLDEQVRREWVHKGRLREQARARARRRIASILAAVTVVAFAIFYLNTRT
jgi:hypothetical protein